jgi:hypothetical protein
MSYGLVAGTPGSQDVRARFFLHRTPMPLTGLCRVASVLKTENVSRCVPPRLPLGVSAATYPAGQVSG